MSDSTLALMLSGGGARAAYQVGFLRHVASRHPDLDPGDLAADNAEDRAAWAEADAELAIDYAYSAIEGAEYAVLDAILARRDADEKSVAAARR